jgi:hypothetical protein
VYVKNGTKILKLAVEAELLQVCKFLVKDVAVYLLYRQPSSQVDSISEIASIVRAANKNNVIFGDFNLPGIV